jgi:divalent metal cation (Fe/Co/Zn/Cd) transporter
VLLTQKVASENIEMQAFGWALRLTAFTIGYNFLEGTVSILLGFQDETLALLGFGVDSFIEVISAIGIARMITRIRRFPDVSRDRFEITALRITGSCFYLLTVGLVVTAVLNIVQGHQPETTFWGIVISAISIVTMWILIVLKMKVGKQLDSQPIIADAKCTKVCLYMSFLLLASSLIYELTHLGYLDSIAALGIAYFSAKEGKEAFEKAQGKASCCDCEEDEA